MGMKVDGGNKKVQGDINVTPLIDVVLVLLIIFMVLTPIIINEMAINLPQKTETVPKDEVPKDQLVAAVCEDGTFALNKTKMDLPALESSLERRLQGKAKKVVFVDAHPDSDYNNVVTLMDSVRNAGADKIGIGSLKEPDSFRACTAAPVVPVATEDGGAAPVPG